MSVRLDAGTSPWIVPDELWDRLELLLPKRERRFRWEYLPQELGFGSGMTCWCRLRDWNEAGVWQRLHEVLLAGLSAASRLDGSRCVVDSSHVRALKGGSTRGRRRSTGAGPARSAI